ncbi:MAG TPA: hypothetical protein VI757_14655 [Bacteroidia bacterium]|nr:hypothetical protein [Bacteroidia bacterium]
MTTTQIKADLFRYIDEINDKNILSSLLRLLSSKRKSKKDFWDELNEKERNEILKAIDDLDNGKAYSFHDVAAKYNTN